MRSWVRFPPGTEFSTCLFTFRHIRSVRNYPIFVSAERTTCIPHCLTANHSSSLCMYHMPFNLSKALSIVVENFMPCRVRWSGCARNLIFEARCRARNGSRDQTQMWNRLDWVAYMTTVEYKETGSCPSWSWVRQIKIRSTTFKKKIKSINKRMLGLPPTYRGFEASWVYIWPHFETCSAPSWGLHHFLSKLITVFFRFSANSLVFGETRRSDFPEYTPLLSLSPRPSSYSKFLPLILNSNDRYLNV